MPVNAYWAYGLRIHAEIVCPELLADPQKAGNPDVTIRLLSAVPDVSESLENGWYEVRPGRFRLAVGRVAQYLVEEGNRISIEPQEGSSPEQVRLFLLGSAMGALLYQRGLFPLHGSAVETEWGAMIFVGAQGIGKSTLAAQFHQRGYRLLSDDVCAVETAAVKPRVLPGLTRLRLCADAYERLGSPHGAQFNLDKFVMPMNEGYSSSPAPLRAIHLLTEKESGDPEFRVLRGFDRVQCLLQNLYRPQYLKGQSTQGALMRLAGNIAERATIVEVSRPREPAMIPALAGFLLTSWAKHFGAHPEGERI